MDDYNAVFALDQAALKEVDQVYRHYYDTLMKDIGPWAKLPLLASSLTIAYFIAKQKPPAL